VHYPAKRGFGLRLIERGLVAEFGGQVETAFDPTGFTCTLAAFIPEVAP
jgi:two-component sensor histidine kinase